MTAIADPKNRTIVRITPATVRAARAGFRVLSPRAPELAARWAERLFRTARRYERPLWEQKALGSAEAGRVAYEDAWVPTWTWTPDAASCDERATVILVHGWEGRGSQLATFVPALLQHGLRVVTFDAPGHGDSPLPHGSVVDHARALRAVANAVGPVHAIIGHSVGGAASLFATRLGVQAKRYALISPPCTPAHFATTFAQMLGLAPAVKEAMIARLEARFEVPFPEIDARIDATRLEEPVLVVHDREDSVVAFEDGKQLARMASSGELLETRGLGHRAILRSERVIDAVTRFVAEGTRPPSFAASLEGELFVRDSRW